VRTLSRTTWHPEKVPLGGGGRALRPGSPAVGVVTEDWTGRDSEYRFWQRETQ
jgi:hypothetical protein